MASYEVDDRRRALLDGMDGNDIPGPDGSGGIAGRMPLPNDTRGPEIPMPGIQEGEPNGAMHATGTRDPFAFQSGLSVEQAMQAANDAAYGYNKHQDANYWRDMYAKDPEYTWKRMIGMGAGPQDAAKFGQWAGGDPNAEVLGGGGGQAQPFNLDPVPGLDLNSILAEIQNIIGGSPDQSRRSAVLSQLAG